MDFVDVKYINILSSRLLKFKKVKNDLYNFRCPICGDSQKNKNRTRGYFYSVKNNTNYKCHNCGVNVSFANFIKTVDPELYKQYRTYAHYKRWQPPCKFHHRQRQSFAGHGEWVF